MNGAPNETQTHSQMFASVSVLNITAHKTPNVVS